MPSASSRLLKSTPRGVASRADEHRQRRGKQGIGKLDQGVDLSLLIAVFDFEIVDPALKRLERLYGLLLRDMRCQALMRLEDEDEAEHDRQKNDAQWRLVVPRTPNPRQRLPAATPGLAFALAPPVLSQRVQATSAERCRAPSTGPARVGFERMVHRHRD